MDEIPEKEKHRRRSIRLKDYDYSTPGAYFVTICAYNRQYLFGGIVNGKKRLNRIGEMIESVWNELPKSYPGIDIDIFVVMPNHIHGIVVLSSVGATPCGCPPPGQAQGPAPTMSLPDVVHRFKSLTTTRCRQSLGQDSSNQFSIKLWQRNYYEHVVRDENELNRIREYILYNPLQWQYDRENPEHVQDRTYYDRWGKFEEMLYGEISDKNRELRTGKDAYST